MLMTTYQLMTTPVLTFLLDQIIGTVPQGNGTVCQVNA